MALKQYTYDSLSAYVKDAKRGSLSQVTIRHGVDSKWFGAHNPQEAGDYVLRGATEDQMRKAREIMDKVDISLHDRTALQWVPSVCGAYPVVGDYLMGMPENMRARAPVESDVSPVKLVFEVGVSQGISVESIASTGAVIAALAMRMSETRPVELWALNCYKSGTTQNEVVSMIKMDVSPVSLAQCVAVFATPQMARMLAFSHLTAMDGDYGPSVGWALGRPSAARVEVIRRTCGLDPQDIILQGAYLPEKELIERDPVKWVHNQLDKQREINP
jgi:hypothetical protein